jgi:hypothetical protein
MNLQYKSLQNSKCKKRTKHEKIRALAEVQELPIKGQECFKQLSFKFSLLTDCEAVSPLASSGPMQYLQLGNSSRRKKISFKFPRKLARKIKAVSGKRKK